MSLLLLFGGGTAVSFDPATLYAQDGIPTLSNANLTVTAGDINDNGGAFSTTSQSSGLFYVEYVINTQGVLLNGGNGFGVANSTSFVGAGYKFLGDLPGQIGYYSATGEVYSNNVLQTTLTSGAVANDVIGMAVDVTNKKVWFRKNSGNWNNSALADPVTNVGGVAPVTTTGDWYFVADVIGPGAQSSVRVTAATLTGYAPTGYLAWDGTTPTYAPVVVTDPVVTPAVGGGAKEGGRRGSAKLKHRVEEDELRRLYEEITGERLSAEPDAPPPEALERVAKAVNKFAVLKAMRDEEEPVEASSIDWEAVAANARAIAAIRAAHQAMLNDDEDAAAVLMLLM